MKTLTKFAAVALLAVTASHSAMAQSFNHVLFEDHRSEHRVDTNDVQINRNGIRFIDTAIFFSSPQTANGVTFTKVEASHAVDCESREISRTNTAFYMNRTLVLNVPVKDAGSKFKRASSDSFDIDFVRLACAVPVHRLRRI